MTEQQQQQCIECGLPKADDDYGTCNACHDEAGCAVSHSKNENGVYTDYQTEVIAQRGRAHAIVNIAICDDGLYRFQIGFQYSYGGYAGPITDDDKGFQTYQQAKEAGIRELADKLHQPFASEPASVHAELADLRQQIERQLAQPSLF